jgi:hypothetical protein
MNIVSLKNIGISTISITADIVPLSRHPLPDGTQNTDLAKVSAKIMLEQPLALDTNILIPKMPDAKADPKIYLPDGEKVDISFEPIAIEDIESAKTSVQVQVASFLEAPNNEAMKAAVVAMAEFQEIKNESEMITLKAGQQYITLEFTKELNPDESGIYTFDTVVPFSSFVITNTAGAKADIIVLMPLDLGTDTTKILEATWIPPVPGATQTEMQKTSIAGRIAVSAYWQFDPAVKIKYRY